MSAQRRASTRAMKQLRPTLAERCGGYCERCARPLPGGVFDLHHRQRRNSRNDSAENCMALCGDCHTAASDAVHRNVSEARRGGFIVPTWDDPATVSVRYMGVKDVWLLPDGTVTEVPDDAA